MDYDSNGIPKICKTCMKNSKIYNNSVYEKWCLVYKKTTSDNNSCKYWKKAENKNNENN